MPVKPRSALYWRPGGRACWPREQSSSLQLTADQLMTACELLRDMHTGLQQVSSGDPQCCKPANGCLGKQDHSRSTHTFATQGSYIHIHRSRDPSSPSECDAAAMSLHASAGGQQELSGPSVDRPTQPLEGALWSQRGPTHSASGRGSLVPAWTDPLSLWKGSQGSTVE
ncbi:unnamed protein product [Boreogadus saida]